MFSRSRSIHFAEMPPLRRSLAFNAQVTTLERRPSRALEFYRNAELLLAALWIFGGFLIYVAVR